MILDHRFKIDKMDVCNFFYTVLVKMGSPLQIFSCVLYRDLKFRNKG